MLSIWDRANPQLRDLVVYEPGKPIEETARELDVDPSAVIKLASNENPLGPPPKALDAMRDPLENAQLYPDYRHNLEEMLAAITPKTKVIFIANPNNPTGTLLAQDKIDNFMARVPENIVTIFDEAYFELLNDPPDALRYVREGRNIVVLRTFSKIHGLASLRVGYGIASRDLIDVLQKTRQPFNVNGIAQAGALAALNDQAHQRKTKEVVDTGRAYLEEQFGNMQLGFVPGAANFVMVNVRDGAAVFK